MSSVLHPVGPEPEKRYWVRRVAVVVAAVLAIVVVIALVDNATSAGSAVQAEPVPPTLVAPTTASPTPSVAETTGSASPSPTAADAASARTSASASPTPGATSSSSAGSKASESSKTRVKEKAAAKKKATPVYSACDPADLRTTLTGDKTVKVKDKTTFSLSLINGGTKTCRVTASPDSFTLTVVSGSDRIWSTKDCPKAQPTTSRVLLPEHAVGWKVTWSGERSGDGCSTKKAAPKKGYYVAIANLDHAKDVRFRLILR